jgi:tryptophan synthase alpha chain
MNRLRDAFQRLQQAGRRALLPYITGGYPDPATTVAILKRIPAERCVCVELGIPFSDPIADGPVIQTSFSRALERGFRIDAFFEALAAERDEIAVPLVAMVSFSIVHRRDPAAFVDRVRAAGIDGLIVPDLSLEEADELASVCRERDCPLIMIAAPTTTAERRQRIAEISEPFIYYQALAGVTGERDELPADLTEHVRELKSQTGKPVCVGFGISQPGHVATVCSVAEGAIVGSAIVRRINAAVDRNAPQSEIVDEVIGTIEQLTTGLPTAGA